jgi:Ser/Thr protein kinase RdoA (MazF antagonist)
VNLIVRCRDPAGRDLVARVRPRWMTEGRIRFEHALARHLSDGGIPVVLPLRLGEGSWIVAGELLCDVYPFVEGRHGRPVPEELRQAGSLLGRFHARSAELPVDGVGPAPMRNQVTPAELEARLEAGAGSRFDGAVRPALRRLGEELSAVGPLPCLLRHGDFHLWNLLYREGPLAIAALLDLDMADFGPRIYDVSYALLFIRHALMAWHGGVVRWEEAYRAFVAGYATARAARFSPGEVRAIPLQMQCTALHFALANASRAEDETARLDVLESDYLAVSRWLEDVWPALERIVLTP